MKTLQELIEALWKDYSGINKQAEAIHRLLEKRGEKVINDHIAFRTFNHPKVTVDAFAKPFLKFGYKEVDDLLEFKDKKLLAKYYEHPDPRNPLIFISELKTHEFSKGLKDIVKNLMDQVDERKAREAGFCISGRPWKPVTYETYLKLKEESEYAAWMAVFGFRANHFTVRFNSLKTFKDLKELNKFLKENGFVLNAAGGEIKGTPKEYLEQSSTMAYRTEVIFADKKETVPACYYEFARRYPQADGKLFKGFIPESADKIFESTDNR